MNIFTTIGVVVVVILVAGYFGVIALAFDLANPVLKGGADQRSLQDRRLQRPVLAGGANPRLEALTALGA